MIVFDDRPCLLGEGAFWHPLRRQFFWFDILNGRLLTRGGGWDLGRMASAAGWIDHDRLILSTETGLAVMDLRDGTLSDIAAARLGTPATRSNDGRADRQGGFWFSTMGRDAQPGLGAIHRFYRGQVRCLRDGMGIPNAICFSPDGRLAHYADTAAQRVWAQPLDDQGWPDGPPRLFLDLSRADENPDGAVIDAAGGFLVALWGSGCVRRYDATGRQTHQIALPGRHSSCPALGGPDLCDLLVTTAQQGIEAPDAAQGLTYLLRAPHPGLPEPQVLL